jgi:hypothetical protein
VSINKDQLATGLKWGVGIAAAVAIAPVIFLAVQGLIGLVIAGAVGMFAIHAAPLFSRWCATLALEGSKGLARRNPVETRQLIAAKRKQNLVEVAKAIQDFAAEVMNVGRHASGLRAAGDPDGAAELEQTHQKLLQVLSVRKDAYRRASEALVEYEQVTSKVDRRWKAAQAALKAQRLAGPSASKELDRIMSEEALESVETAMNQVFAGLDHAMLTEAPALTNNASPVIDVVAVPVKEYAK